MLDKLKKNIKHFFTSKSAFSLVELIVVIAIMAVMAAVLAPALLGYVEKSRMQKDDSAMNEITNAIHLSLADQEIYDELVQVSVQDNYSCYCDEDATTNIYDNKILLNNRHYWLFNDQARLLDETVYKPAGKMRGVTITFKPNGTAEYILKDGIINKIGDESTEKGAQSGKTLSCSEFEATYNRIRSTIGDTLKVSSQTYRNSDYTIFISMGTTGGNQADAQDAVQVWGQFNGTNLDSVASPVSGSSQHGAPIEDLNGVDTTLEDNTWEEIHQVVSAGKAEEAGWTVGSTAKLQINNKTYTAMIIGLDHDGENTATFMITDYTQDVYSMLKDSTPNNYMNSHLRKYLNTSLFEQMNNKDFIKRKEQLKDNVFILSLSEYGKYDEVFGSSSQPNDGSVYEYFLNNEPFAKPQWTRTYITDIKFYVLLENRWSVAMGTTGEYIYPAFVIG